MLIMPTLNESDIDAVAREWPQLGTRKRDLGSWTPGRVRLLRNFTNRCRLWYEWRRDPCYTARRTVYNALVHRHGSAAVVRWCSAIKAVLDRAEAEVRGC